MWNIVLMYLMLSENGSNYVHDFENIHSLGRLMLKLNLQYFVHLMQRANSLEKTLKLGNTESRRRSGQQRMRSLDGIPDSMDLSSRKLQEIMKDRKDWNAVIQEFTKSLTWLSNWTAKLWLVEKEQFLMLAGTGINLVIFAWVLRSNIITEWSLCLDYH